MILDISLPTVAIPLVVLIGLILVVIGRETLEVMSFAIGALGGGVLAYMILNGFLYSYNIPLYVEIPVAALLIFGGGMLGRGAMATIVALLTALVFLDVIQAILGEGMLLVTILISIFIFVVMIALIQKYLTVFSAFIGGCLVAIAFNGLPIEDVIIVRVIQLSVAILFCAIGGLVQYRIKKWKDTRGEEIVWVPSG